MMKTLYPAFYTCLFLPPVLGRGEDPELRPSCPSGSCSSGSSAAPRHWPGFTRSQEFWLIPANKQHCPSPSKRVSLLPERQPHKQSWPSRVPENSLPCQEQGRGFQPTLPPARHKQAGQTRVRSLAPVEHTGGAGNITST